MYSAQFQWNFSFFFQKWRQFWTLNFCGRMLKHNIHAKFLTLFQDFTLIGVSWYHVSVWGYQPLCGRFLVVLEIEINFKYNRCFFIWEWDIMRMFFCLISLWFYLSCPKWEGSLLCKVGFCGHPSRKSALNMHWLKRKSGFTVEMST